MRKQKHFELHFHRAWLGGVLAFAMIVTPHLSAQTSVQPSAAAETKVPVFDVISIKPNKTGSGTVSISQDDGNFDATNVSLKSMVLNAYGLKEAQLSGLPKWDDSLRFDIKAKVVEPDKKAFAALTQQQNRDMLQPILTGRFQLQFHHETKILPVYELVVARGGPKFQESKITGDDKAANGMGAGSMRVRNHVMSSTGIPLSSLVAQLSSQLHRVVVDKTGLNGKYDLDLSWSPDDGAPPDPDSAAPSIFTALQEQLGLRLQPSKSSIETFVIDHVELPSED